MIAETSMVIKI